MDDKMKGSLVVIFVALFILFVFHVCNSIHWNNGYCSCGGEWEYQQAVGHRYSTSYLYKCNKCGKIAEFDDNYEVQK